LKDEKQFDFGDNNDDLTSGTVIEMRMAYLASFLFPPKRVVIGGGWWQVGVSHFYKKFSIL